MPRPAKLLLLATLLAICAGAVVVQRQRERERAATPPNALYEVVWKQIRALQSGDATTAYRHASTSYQEKLNTESFGDLAHSEYPGLVRAARVEFGAVRFDGAQALVPVYFFLPDGDVVPCLYRLVNERNTWKIDGARVLPRWPAGRRLGGMRA
jgi:hypothetical protein